MVIVQVNYRHPEMPKASWEARYTDDRATPFLSVEGLQWKIWLDGGDAPTAGGVYLFADRRTAQAYIDGPIVARMKANPDIMDLTLRMSDVRARMSEITHAPISALQRAAE